MSWGGGWCSSLRSCSGPMMELQHELGWWVVQQFKVLLRTHEGTTTSAGVAGGAAVSGLARDPWENKFFLTEAHGQPQEGHVREPAVVLLEGEQHPPWSGPAAHPMEDAARFTQPTKSLMINLTRRTYSNGVAKALGRSGRTLPRLINLGKSSS